MTSKLLFATQIYHAKLTTSETSLKLILKDLKTESAQIQKMDQTGSDWSNDNYTNGYTSYSSHDKLHQMSSTFSDLEKLISKHVAKFLKNLDYSVNIKNLKMTDCWLNIMNENVVHTAHLHPRSVFSGTFYVAVPKNASAIQFQDPRLTQFMNAPVPNSTARIHNQRFISILPKPGDVILFESWLKHEVSLNKSKLPRISVSFNYDWK
jgi:uncharacterized protein (TIGR02466 family)